MKIIKVSTGLPENRPLLLRQTENSEGLWGDCKFVVNDNIDKCDWWFVLHGSGLTKSETCLCDPEHIVYVSMEPDEKISRVSDKFLEQFSCLITCDRGVIHHNKVYENWITWWVGIVVNKKNKQHVFQPEVNLDYNQLSRMECPGQKANKISVILSNKKLSKGHRKRVEFIDKIAKSPISQHIDIYGHGYRDVPDKWDAIAPYKYHMVLENSVQGDYWSEKLADAFLGFSMPIYYGCPNIYHYFDKESIYVIDIDNFDHTVMTLESIIDSTLYDDSTHAIKKSRSLILNRYNIFNLMSEMAINYAARHQNVTLNTNAFYRHSLIKRAAKFLLSKVRSIV